LNRVVIGRLVYERMKVRVDFERGVGKLGVIHLVAASEFIAKVLG